MDEETYRRRPFEGAPPFRCPAVPPRRASGAVGAPGGVTSEVGAAAARASPGRSGSEPSRLHDVEVRMIEVHDRGHGGARSRRVRTTIDGLSVVGAFAILAETGDPSRVPSRRTSLTLAGRAPRANESGNFRSQTTSGRSRPARRAQRPSSGLLPHTAGRSPRRAPAAVGRHSTQRPKARGTSSSASSRPAPHGAPTSPPAGGRWHRLRPEATLAWAGRTRLDPGENPKLSLRAPAALPSSSDEGASEEPGCSFGRARRAGSGPRRSTPAAAIQKRTPIAPTRHQSCRSLVERGR